MVTLNSIQEAILFIGKRGIDSVLKGKTKTCGGFICLYEYKYINTDDLELQKIIKNANTNNGINNGLEKRFKNGNKPWNFKIKWKNPTKLKKVYQFDKTAKFIKEWNCAMDASIELNINYDGIQNCCRGINKTSGGYVWRYKK